MKTLFITVGTRQIGWRCKDDTICCFGADGDRNEHPKHIDKLYQELGVERGSREGQRWGVQDLSQRYYQHCLTADDFSAVELLLDHQIINDQYSQGLEHVVLWGSNQPETTAWVYRNKDTRWLAHLMAGKIRQTWPELKVEVFEPVVDANNNQAIRHALDTFIVQHTQQFTPESNENEFTFLIQSKGAVPAIAQSLEICAAGLVRQYQVFNIIPVEPTPLYSAESQSANHSQQCQSIPIGEYFWPIERLRIVSAWQRGDFHEAAIWLMAHQSRYQLLYHLAKCLTLATNWQMDTFLKNEQSGVSHWLNRGSLVKAVDDLQLRDWHATLQLTLESSPARTWETSFLIYLLLCQGNYTDAFMRFAQTLERLLYIRSEAGNWLSQEDTNGHHVGFKQLIDTWFKVEQKTLTKSHYNQFDRIRNTRNQIVHQAESMTIEQIQTIWVPKKRSNQDSEASNINAVYNSMTQTLKQVCDRAWQLPDKPLLRSLYEWGLNQLQIESETLWD